MEGWFVLLPGQGNKLLVGKKKREAQLSLLFKVGKTKRESD
jgi:hypothetical protein